MLRKVFKTILVFTICFGITLPVNAGSVSVSDGSAFISKSEMSYELNNLSNRMTQLENSLDSRIDSLVSSYLTRNGVWNANKQKITTDAQTTHIFTSEWGSGNLGTTTVQIVHFDECIVANTSKSGLVFGSFGYGNKHAGVANNWYYGCNLGNRPGWVWDQNCIIQLFFYEAEQGANSATDGKIKTVITIGSTLGFKDYGTRETTFVAIPLPNWNLVPFTFFVDKGKQIWWRWVDDVSFYNANSVRSVNFEGSKMQVQLKELSIY